MAPLPGNLEQFQQSLLERQCSKLDGAQDDVRTPIYAGGACVLLLETSES
jgi:hypothetical protein